MKVNKSGLSIVIILAISSIVITTFLAKPSNSIAQNNSFTESQIKDIEKVMYNYLMEHPEIIFEAADKYKENEQNIQNNVFTQKFKEYQKDLISGPYSPSLGPKDADIVIVEFFDYNCGYCKKAVPDIKKIMAEDKNVRFVFKELPILSPASRIAAEWALAAHKQGKYWEFHQKLMVNANLDVKVLERHAKEVGLDVDKLKNDANDPELKKAIDNNLIMTRELGIRGTPAFIINDFLARGYIGYNTMKSRIAQIRAEKG